MENYHCTSHPKRRILSSNVMHTFHGWMVTSFTEGLIFKLTNALEKMEFMVSPGLVMMNPLEVIFPIEELDKMYYKSAIYGP